MAAEDATDGTAALSSVFTGPALGTTAAVATSVVAADVGRVAAAVVVPNIGDFMAFRLSNRGLGWLGAAVGREAAGSPSEEEDEEEEKDVAAGAGAEGAVTVAAMAEEAACPRADDGAGAAEDKLRVGGDVVMELSEGAEAAGVLSLPEAEVVVVVLVAASAELAAVVVEEEEEEGGVKREVEATVAVGAGSGAGFSGSGSSRSF